MIVSPQESIPVKFEPHSSLNYTKGVIRDQRGDLHGLTDDELMNHLSKEGVVGIHRLQYTPKKGNRNVKLPGHTYFLTFMSQELPQYVKIGCDEFTVKKYEPRPILCAACAMYGHRLKVCRNKDNPKCRHCGDAHTFNECMSKDEPRGPCIHCGSKGHETGSNLCGTYFYEKEILEVADRDRLLLWQAREKVNTYSTKNPGSNYAKAASQPVKNLQPQPSLQGASAALPIQPQTEIPKQSPPASTITHNPTAQQQLPTAAEGHHSASNSFDRPAAPLSTEELLMESLAYSRKLETKIEEMMHEVSRLLEALQEKEKENWQKDQHIARLQAHAKQLQSATISKQPELPLKKAKSRAKSSAPNAPRHQSTPTRSHSRDSVRSSSVETGVKEKTTKKGQRAGEKMPAVPPIGNINSPRVDKPARSSGGSPANDDDGFSEQSKRGSTNRKKDPISPSATCEVPTSNSFQVLDQVPDPNDGDAGDFTSIHHAYQVSEAPEGYQLKHYKSPVQNSESNTPPIPISEAPTANASQVAADLERYVLKHIEV